MNHIVRLVTALALSLGMQALTAPAGYAGEPTLKSVQEKIEKKYPDIAHVGTKTLDEKLAAGEKIVLFDVREADEFAVSRIPGAVRVDPGIWSSTFLKRFSELAAGTTAVFYCSVGVRSTRLAAAVQSDLLKRGAKSVFNLRGGAFAWHNEARQLADDQGATKFIHPFNETWGRLVDRKHLLRYKPGNTKGN
ncbi:putative adenylyltransferase/sulfurtransferase MoeZ [bacterium MnTg02]|nr:putative adenylyltransferase/sulfurtransferase MoeZ [bacterium MnTg02]